MTVTFKNILVPTDFSPTSARAVEYAQALAARFGASLHLLHVVEDPVTAAAWTEGYALSLASLRQRFIEESTAQLARLKETIAGIETTTQTLVGNPARTVAEMAAERHCDLIVMGTHGRGGVTHLLLGSVAERVIRLAPCPVLTVRTVKEAAPIPERAVVGAVIPA